MNQNASNDGIVELAQQAQNLLNCAGDTSHQLRREDKELCREVGRVMLSLVKDEVLKRSLGCPSGSATA